MEQSKGLLFPVQWHEPFGLAIIESLYAGCPVFGSKMGSLPELIIPEVGFLSESIFEITRAVKELTFSPQICHDYATENFNAKVMAQNYFEVYQRFLDGEQLN
jgi:glycosyltransferase involved in cell wall biosynthesis